MATTELKLNEQELQTEVSFMVKEAEVFKVTNDEQYHEAVERANTAKFKLQGVTEFFAPMKEAAHKAWKAVCARENLFAPDLEKVKKLYTQKAADYQYQKQREQEAKEREALAKAEAAEKAKKDKLEAEARAKEQAAIAAKAAGDAEAAEKAAAEADALREKQAEVYVAPKAVTQAPRNAAMSVQVVWEPQITDETKVPVMFWKEIDLAKLKRMKKDNPALEVPGVRFVQKAQGGTIGRAA